MQLPVWGDLAAPYLTPQIFTEIQESDRLRKQFLLTGYMELLLTDELGASHDIEDSTRPFHILTPADPKQRGSQLSIHISDKPHITHQELQSRGILVSAG